MAADTNFITVVSGIPRSGTSMMMRMLECGGLPVLTDGVRGADDDNPRGYYEFEPVKRLQKDASWLAAARGQAIKIIYVFLSQLPDNYRYKVIFLRRSLDDVIASQKLMLERRKEADSLSDSQLLELYNTQLQRLYTWLKHKDNFEVLYLNYEEIVGDPRNTVLDIARFLALPLNADAMAQCIEPALHRNRAGAA